MVAKRLKDLIDKNGVNTRRWVRDGVEPSAETMAQAKRQSAVVPSTVAADPQSFHGVYADAQPLPPLNHYEHRFMVTLEHEGTGRALQVPYSHLSEEEPSAQAVLAHMAFEARAYTHHDNAEHLADTFGLDTTPGPDGRSEADIAFQNFQHSHDELKDLLGGDYRKTTRQALEREPFRSAMVEEVEKRALQLADMADKSAKAAFVTKKWKVYGALKAGSLVARTGVKVSQSRSEFNDQLTSLHAAADELEADGSRVGWRLHDFAERMRAVDAAERGEHYDASLGRSAGKLPGMDSAADDLSREARAAGMAGDDQAMLSLEYWSNRYRELRESNDPAETLLDTAADMMHESKTLQRGAANATAVLDRHARNLVSMVRDR